MRIRPEEDETHALSIPVEEAADISRGVVGLTTPQMTPDSVGADGLLPLL